MASIAPRRYCVQCGRSIAVVAGRFARHDDPAHRTAQLISCTGSLQPAPLLQDTDRYGTHSLFELLAEFAAREGSPHDAQLQAALLAPAATRTLAAV